MKRLKTLAAALAALTILLAGTALAGKRVYNFTGGVLTRPDQGLSKFDLEPEPDDGSFFSWAYTFMFTLDDGSSGMIQFTYWKMYFKTQRGLYFAFSDKGEEQIIRKAILGAKEIGYTGDPPELVMGSHYWRGFYPNFDVHLDFPGEEGLPKMKADLRFHSRTPGWRPGEGPVHYGSPEGDWYDVVVMIPWADVSGTITLNGSTRKVKGFGYSDHNTQNILPTKQCDKLMALRSFSDEYAVHFLEYIAPEHFDGERTTWILIMKGDRILHATDNWEREMFDFRTEPKRGYQYPTRVTAAIDLPACRLTGEIRGTKYIGALDALDEIPAFLRGIASRFVSAPVFIRQNAEVDWHLVIPGEGIDTWFHAKGVFETTIVQ
ncbi:hypothetical protein ACFL4G_06685 [Thermodesulfobacteriota bacterium]